MLIGGLIKFISNKWIWIGLIVLILIIILNRNWYKVKRLFQPANIKTEPGEKPLTDERKSQLESLARNMYDSIYGVGDMEPYDKALLLTSTELKYMSKYYRRSVTQGNWLYTDIDDEYFSLGNDRDTRLMARLSEVGEKG